jgi:hypothetical protein
LASLEIGIAAMSTFRDVDPGDLRLPTGRQDGAVPSRYYRQVAIMAAAQMGWIPTVEVTEGRDGELMPALPEGAAVTVTYSALPQAKPAAEKRRIQFPLIPSDEPGSVQLTNERIAEILNEEDASPRH